MEKGLDKMNKIMFYNVAEYSENASKMVIKHQQREIRVDIWNSSYSRLSRKSYKYFTKKKAYNEYLKKVAKAVQGGWKVLSIFPKGVEWGEGEDYG